MKKIVNLFIIVGLLFSMSIAMIYADSKTIPEGRQIQLQYGYAFAKDTLGFQRYAYKTSGTCSNSQAVLAVYVRDKNGKSQSQNSCSGLNSTSTIWYSDGNVAHSHTASSIIPR